MMVAPHLVLLRLAMNALEEIFLLKHVPQCVETVSWSQQLRLVMTITQRVMTDALQTVKQWKQDGNVLTLLWLKVHVRLLVVMDRGLMDKKIAMMEMETTAMDVLLLVLLKQATHVQALTLRHHLVYPCVERVSGLMVKKDVTTMTQLMEMDVTLHVILKMDGRVHKPMALPHHALLHVEMENL